MYAVVQKANSTLSLGLKASLWPGHLGCNALIHVWSKICVQNSNQGTQTRQKVFGFFPQLKILCIAHASRQLQWQKAVLLVLASYRPYTAYWLKKKRIMASCNMRFRNKMYFSKNISPLLFFCLTWYVVFLISGAINKLRMYKYLHITVLTWSQM